MMEACVYSYVYIHMDLGKESQIIKYHYHSTQVVVCSFKCHYKATCLATTLQAVLTSFNSCLQNGNIMRYVYTYTAIVQQGMSLIFQISLV